MTDGFRDEVRAWLEVNVPASMRTPMPETELPWGGRKAEFPNSDTKLWLDRAAEKGWTVPTWPREYGGAGLSEEQASILKEEIGRLGARPPLWSFGAWMLGPVLLENGTAEQKAEFLPAIARGETRWCQGYSEPGAGSDLASLRLRADDHGDHWRLNGQKIWTSFADKSDWIFGLVRTDRDAAKHKGISFILVDMASAGIETRLIELISGESHFCETFFDDVRVPKSNLVGELNGGWRIAKKLLQYERQNVSAVGFGGDRIDLAELARTYGAADANGRLTDPWLRHRVAAATMEERAVAILTAHAQREAERTGIGSLTSAVKFASAVSNKQRNDLAVELAGMSAAGWSGTAFDDPDLRLTRSWLRSKGNSIEGGTSEIQLNVIAKNILGLP